MPTLEFLGWEPTLPRAATWIAERLGQDLRGVVVALPGARAGRRLGEHLARRLGPGWHPPRILTSGQLTDELLAIEGVPAGRMARTLAWAHALRASPPDELRALGSAGREGERDLAPWLGLAERVRGLFGELGAEGLDFDDVAARVERGEADGAPRRWRALGAVQRRMEALLQGEDRVDPHLARRRALEAGARREPRAVVLVAVQDMNGLLRGALAGTEAPIHALVPLPEERRRDVNALGCLETEAVIERGFELPLDAWEVTATPDHEARRVLERIAAWNGRYAAEEITLGIADPEVVPFLRRRLTKEDVRARDAAGTPVARGLPARLLRALALYLKQGRYADWASLMRHPDLETRLVAESGGDVVSLVDGYQQEHLPDRVPERDAWLGSEPRAIASVDVAARRVLGDLAQPSRARRPLAGWAASIRGVLENVYGERELDPDREPERELLLGLSALAEALEELEGVESAGGSTQVRGEEAIDFLLRALAGRAIAPAPARRGEPTVELLGWLELALDDAPALVVSGFQDGLVPETLTGDAFLPDRLRSQLGMLDNRRRLARDLVAAEVMLRTRGPDSVRFLSARRSGANDPLLPSRIVFHGSREGLAERVQRITTVDEEDRPAAGTEPEPPRELPRGPVRPLESIAVTAFKVWLASPYRFYLQRSLGLDELDPAAREMNARGFGILAHDVLEDFGRTRSIRESVDEGQIHDFLVERLDHHARSRYGAHPLPAVSLQVDQLAYRLRGFARDQVKRRRKGWDIAHVEWAPGRREGVRRVVDGDAVNLQGRIDRIDVHPDGPWAIWDYKSGDRAPAPKDVFVEREERWVDLQLPLYSLLAVELEHESVPQLGYAWIAPDPEQETFRPLDLETWNEDRIGRAYEEADRIIREIRSGALWSAGTWQPREGVFHDLLGLDLVGVPGSEPEEGTEE